MSKRNLLIILMVVVGLFITTGIPTKSNPDPDDLFAGRNVNMSTGWSAWPDPEGDVYLQRQNEPSLAVSTLNPLHLLAGTNDYRSVDTWESVGDLPGIPLFYPLVIIFHELLNQNVCHGHNTYISYYMG